jgi:putative glutamine amidotransferase
VVSWHHQAIRDVPSGWRLAARSRDELLSLRDANANAVARRSPFEAIEHETHPWAVAVQWHPEFTFEEAEHFRLFQAFVQAALRFSPRLAGSLPDPEPVPQVA